MTFKQLWLLSFASSLGLNATATNDFTPDFDINLLDRAQYEAFIPLPDGLIDANNDKVKWWYFDNRGLVYEDNTDMAANDWAISNPILFEAGKKYKITITTHCGYSSYPERIAVSLGENVDAAEMTETIIPPTTVNWENDQTLTGTFDAIYNRKLRLGLHACSDADMAQLYVTHITVNSINDAGITENQYGDKQPFKICGNIVYIPDSVVSDVLIYNQQGSCVKKFTSQQTTRQTSLPAGIYILITDTQHYKIAIQ